MHDPFEGIHSLPSHDCGGLDASETLSVYSREEPQLVTILGCVERVIKDENLPATDSDRGIILVDRPVGELQDPVLAYPVVIRSGRFYHFTQELVHIPGSCFAGAVPVSNVVCSPGNLFTPVTRQLAHHGMQVAGKSKARQR